MLFSFQLGQISLHSVWRSGQRKIPWSLSLSDRLSLFLSHNNEICSEASNANTIAQTRIPSKPYRCIPQLDAGNFFKLFILHCPQCDYQNVLVPVLSPFFGHMLQVGLPDQLKVLQSRSSKTQTLIPSEGREKTWSVSSANLKIKSGCVWLAD